MPLMMDHSINVDDLFGEPASIELGLSSASTKGLAQRLDEMRLLGCCRYVCVKLNRYICLCTIANSEAEKLRGQDLDASRTSLATA